MKWQSATDILQKACAPLMAVMISASASSVDGVTLEIKNGMRLEGNIGKIASIGKDIYAAEADGETGTTLIVFLDDGLRRTFVSTYQRKALFNDPSHVERIPLWQPVADNGPRVTQVGSINRVSAFDKFGRRLIQLSTQKGKLNIVQGITEITPLWTKVEGLTTTSMNPHVWDMRIATSSIPREILSSILKQRLGESPDAQLSAVRLYLQAERYRDAEQELRSAIKNFPVLADKKEQLTGLRAAYAKQLLNEIKLRRGAGQHQKSYYLLANFPDEGIAGETLIEASELVQEYDKEAQRGQRILELLDENLQTIPDGNRRQRLERFIDELQIGLGTDTISRLANFLQLADDENVVSAEKKLTSEQKLALAVSGWVLKPQGATENLSVAMSLLSVRQLVLEYLQTEPGEEARRQAILEELRSLEGSDPQHIAWIIAAMRPPLEPLEITMAQGNRPAADEAEQATEASVSNGNERSEDKRLTEKPAGMFAFTVPGIPGLDDGEEFEYLVQLPPEYNSYRRYPTIVTMHARDSTPEMQVDWWAGSYNQEKRQRFGQAGRYGYIVIAPRWATAQQTRYGYTAREHAAVLVSLRDAIQRFAVDTDRVYLSGHGMGGDACWDITLAHPDIWAGSIPISATANYGDKSSPGYVTRYWENAASVPMYFVSGALDASRASRNAVDLDRYLTRTGYDVMVVEYLGRGGEHFSDEIQRIFAWMGLPSHERNFFPQSFHTVSMRKWDSFFWWLDLAGLPKSSHVAPQWWPPEKGARPSIIKAHVFKSNVFVKTAAAHATIWLAPDLIDLNQRIEFMINGRKTRHDVLPSVKVLLEDVRRRGDRQHPFWAKLDYDSGRLTVAE